MRARGIDDAARASSAARALPWLVMLGCAACNGGESGRRLRLIIDVRGSGPLREAIDEVAVTLTASRTPEPATPELCEPQRCIFATDGGRALPIVVDFHRGEAFGERAYFRVEWLSSGTAVARREIAATWPSVGSTDVQVPLVPECVAAACPADRQCLYHHGIAECVDVPAPGVFDDSRLVLPGQTCDREAGACPSRWGADADADADADGDIGDAPDVAEDGDTPSCTPLDGGCPEGMVYVPGGSFVMGSDPGEGLDDEMPEHEVTVSAFCIDQTEVTNAAYLACELAGACSAPVGGTTSLTRLAYYRDPAFADYPVLRVDYAQAERYCTWAGKRLPWEAEWEKACRGGCEIGGDPATCDDPADERTYPWGDDRDECWLANSEQCDVATMGRYDTDRVGARPLGASPYCALDMAGNAAEIVADYYHFGTYGACGEPCVDPHGDVPTGERITRGGSYYVGQRPRLRCADRERIDEGQAAVYIGFRCAAPPP